MAILDALWLPIMALYAVVMAAFLCLGLNLLYMTILALTRPPRHRSPQPVEDFPFVTVQLPIFNELYVVERLIQAACELDWPTDRLEIQVLDDSTDETQFIAGRLVSQRAAQGIPIVHLRRRDRVGYKAGALQEGLAAARGEFIAIFDADFVPPRHFLQTTIPYFAEPRIGFVQARWGHLNRSYSLLTELQSVIIDAHFLVDQVARNRGGYFMNFNGTAGVWRRAAILDAGGWQYDTLAEDLDLSYRAQLQGWEGVYLPDLVADAELPVTVAGYRRQQRRWAAGSFACALKLLPQIFRAPLSLGVKIQAALHLLGYLGHTCLLVMFLLQPFLLYYAHQQYVHSGALAQQGVGWWPLAVVLALPGLAPGLYLLYGQWRATGSPLRRVPYVLLASIMGAGIMLTVVGAILRVALTKQVVFERTPKYGIEHAGDSWDGKRYVPGADPALAMELVLAGFSLATLTYAASLKNWGSLLFMSYFLLGLTFIIFSSVSQMTWPLGPRTPVLRQGRFEAVAVLPRKQGVNGRAAAELYPQTLLDKTLASPVAGGTEL